MRTGEGGVIIYYNMWEICFELPINRKSENNSDDLSFVKYVLGIPYPQLKYNII